MYTVVIADDHDLIREGIKSIIKKSSEYKVIAEARDGEEAFELVSNLKPDILLLDISLPKISGLDIIERIRYVSKDTRILVVSVHKSGPYVLKALKCGVKGYINKENAAEELLPALSRIVRGQTYLGSAVSSYLAESLQEEKKSLPKESFFTPRELDILRLVAEGKTSREIARTLFLSRRTVENYKNNLLKKLGLHKSSDLIRYALENKIIE